MPHEQLFKMQDWKEMPMQYQPSRSLTERTKDKSINNGDHGGKKKKQKKKNLKYASRCKSHLLQDMLL